MHEAMRGPLNGAATACQALQGSQTESKELLVGTQENSVSKTVGSSITPPLNNDFSQKSLQKSIESVSKPGRA